MRKLRVTASMRKRLADARDINTGNARRGGVMVIPRMMTPAEWEARAMREQEQLIADARDSMPQVIESESPFEDVTDKYRPDLSKPRE